MDLSLLRSRFKPAPPEPSRHPGGPRLSAVLVALFDGPDGPEVLYTRRSDRLRNHPGEVSFPGGRVDPGDVGPLEAALREAEEEVGIVPSDVDAWGHFTDFVTHRGDHICAYVAHARGKPPQEPVSRDEVDAVFTVPLATLCDPAVYEARRIDGMGPGRRVHYFHVEPQVVWGITGELTARFLERTGVWAPPPEVRTIAELHDFRPERL